MNLNAHEIFLRDNQIKDLKQGNSQLAQEVERLKPFEEQVAASVPLIEAYKACINAHMLALGNTIPRTDDERSLREAAKASYDAIPQ